MTRFTTPIALIRTNGWYIISPNRSLAPSILSKLIVQLYQLLPKAPGRRQTKQLSKRDPLQKHRDLKALGREMSALLMIFSIIFQ